MYVCMFLFFGWTSMKIDKSIYNITILFEVNENAGNILIFI